MAVFTRFSEIAARSTIPLHFQIKVHPPPPKLIVPILTPRATTFLRGASFSKWSRGKPDWASVWKHSWNCAKFREEGGGEGCQAAKTKVSSVKSREKNSNSIREKKGRGGDPNRILVVTGSGTVGILEVIAMPEKLLRGLDQLSSVLFGYF